MRYQFVDCRWELGKPSRGRELYLEGHIPGASFLDVDADLSSEPGPRGRHPLPGAEQFARAAARAGVGDAVFVVAYGNMGGPERLWWLLRHFGHDACAVIDFDAWRGPLSSGAEDVEPANFVPRDREGDTVDADELVRRLGELVVVDARTPTRYHGASNSIDRKPGRIPGALNAPWSEPLPGLPAGELVAYCGSGVTACVVLHRLYLSGREGKLYPGSWSEWEQRDDLPALVDELILHLANGGDWRAAKATGEYAPPMLSQDGYIHLSTPELLHLPANAMYSGTDDLVLLWVDPARVNAEIRYELPEPGSRLAFPHIYGPLNVDAVIAETPLDPWERGAFRLPALPGR